MEPDKLPLRLPTRKTFMRTPSFRLHAKVFHRHRTLFLSITWISLRCTCTFESFDADWTDETAWVFCSSSLWLSIFWHLRIAMFGSRRNVSGAPSAPKPCWSTVARSKPRVGHDRRMAARHGFVQKWELQNVDSEGPKWWLADFGVPIFRLSDGRWFQSISNYVTLPSNNGEYWQF